MVSRKLFVGYMFLLSITLGIGYASGIQRVPVFLGSIFFYSIIAYLFHALWCSLRKKSRKKYTDFLNIFLYKLSLYVSIFLLLIGYFIIHQTHIFPAKMPVYTLSNGEQTLVFQAMSHIGSPQFYEEVRRNIHKAKRSGFALYYEGVKSGSKENKAAFDTALGVKLNPNSYQMLASLYGVIAQDNQTLLHIENDKDYNVDLNLDEIMTLYHKKVQDHSSKRPDTPQGKIYDIETDILSKLSGLGEKQLFLLRYFNQSLINFMIKHESFREKVLALSGKQDIFHVILQERNKHLVDAIVSSEHEGIIITYGLMHFPGVLQLLQSIDPKWEITQTQYHQVIYPAGENNS